MDIIKAQKKIIFFEIVIFCILAFMVGSAQTLSPFFGDINVIDEGQFAAWANQMLHGKLMFRDIYITYGPLFVYPLYLLFKLFSPSVFLVRIYIILGSIFGIIVTNILMLEIGLKRVGRYLMNIMLILLPIMILRQALGFLILYFLILSIRSNSKLIAFATGIFNGLAFLVSPEIGIFTILLTYFYYIVKIFYSKSKTVHILQITKLSLGLVLVALVFIFWAGVEGWLSGYLSVTKQVLTDFSGINTPNGQNLPDIFNQIPKSIKLVAWIKFLLSKNMFIYYTLMINVYLLLIYTLKLILKKITATDIKLSLILFYSLFLFYSFVGRPDFPHLFFGLAPLLLILSYYFVKSFNEFTTGKKIYLFSTLLIMFFIARLLYINNPQIKNIAKLPHALTVNKANPGYIGPILISQKQEKYFKDLKAYFTVNTTPKDDLFILSDEPVLYFILNRDDATIYDLPYIADLKSMREKMLSELKTAKPKYILYNKHAWAVDEINNVVRLPEISNYIFGNYTLITTIDGEGVYKFNNE